MQEPGGNGLKHVGTITLATLLTDDAVVLRDVFQLTHRGKQITLKIIHTCRKDNFLSPLRIESEGEGDDEVGTFVATVADGKMTVRAEDGQETKRELPEGTITMAAMMRLITLVPATPGSVYRYDCSLESEELNLKRNYELTVMPPETITSGDQQIECSKFKLTGGGILPAYYWVTRGGVLQRIKMDDRKIIELKPAA